MAAVDIFRPNHVGLTLPSRHIFLISPDDDNELDYVTRAVGIAVDGDLHVLDATGEEVVIPGGVLGPGGMHAIRVRKVFATGTTATGIVGFI